MAVLASDSFTRTVANGWGTADTGGAWTRRQGIDADYSVNGTQAVLDMHASGTRSATLPLTAADVDITVKATWDVATALLVPVQLMGRWASTTAHYYCTLGHSAVATIRLSLLKFDVSATTLAGPITVTSAHSLGQWWRVRFQIEGTSLRAKAWLDGTGEPGSWTVTFTDSTFASGGAVGIKASGASVQTYATYDDLSVNDFAAAPAGAPSMMTLLGVK